MLPVSEKAWRTQGSKMFVAINSRVKVEDLLQGVIVQSGNDATIVLAEGLAGSEEAFAGAMNDKAQELGLAASHFVNASGLPAKDHYSTARDLAVLAKALITRFPQYFKYYSQTEFTYNKIKQGNRNPLLYKGIGADGLKTGHTEEGGYGLIGTGLREGRRVIFVVNGLKDMQIRADEATKILEWGLGGFVNLSPYADGQAVTNAKVVLGTAPSVPLKVGRTFKVTVPKLSARDVELTAVTKEPVVAPIELGQEIGMLNVRLNGGQPLTLPLVAATEVPRMGLISRTIAKALYATTGKEF
jgi:serine-type D-Ala-D-Ala carboxypeptidase (penicillin-binding protein 5/6)